MKLSLNYHTKTRRYDLAYIDYDFRTQKFMFSLDENYRSLRVDIDQPFALWSELRTTIDTLCNEGFDRQVDCVVVDDEHTIFLNDETDRRKEKIDNWKKSGKDVIPASDIRKSIPLPDHVFYEDVIFVVFDEGGDEEDAIFQWAMFFPSQK